MTNNGILRVTHADMLTREWRASPGGGRMSASKG